MALNCVSPAQEPSTTQHRGAFVDNPKRIGNAGIASTAQVAAEAQIHPSASVGHYCVIGPGVSIGERCRIGNFAEIGDGTTSRRDRSSNVTIGSDCCVGSHCSITGHATLGAEVNVGSSVTILGDVNVGDGTRIHSGAVIGDAGQFPGRSESNGRVRIGRNVVVREHCCITSSVLTSATVVGDGSYLMSRTQIDHDCVLGTNIKTATGVTLGGSVIVGDNAYIGMNAVVHQTRRIGAGTMIGMNSAVMRHLPPFATLVMGKFTKLNIRGLKLRGATDADISAIQAHYLSRKLPRTQIGGSAHIDIIDLFYSEIGEEPAFEPQPSVQS